MTTTPVLASTWAFGLKANAAAWEVLGSGGTAMDAVERGATVIELDPELASVGVGGDPNAEGAMELDAAIMDGRTGQVGSVVGLRRVATPTSVARRVMERTPHLMLAGEGAGRFARLQGFEERDLLTDPARRRWLEWRSRPGRETEGHDTIGLIARDVRGDLAAACTTSGVSWKLPGRVSDSALVGCGLYADNGVGAAVATGMGEIIARVCGSFLIVERMRAGVAPQEACGEAVRRILHMNASGSCHGIPIRASFLAMDREGRIGTASIRSGFQYALCREGRHVLADGEALLTDPVT
jgi:isoaspartyl peptidase/L-asparaginase-like protein (Ntn-hydrolase superfamily)